MLATEPAQGLFGYSDMTSSFQTRGHLNASSYTSSGKTSQPKQNIMSSSTSNVNGGQNGLHPPPTPIASPNPPPNAFPQQDDNIMNRRADMNSSLYQICLSLRMRLAEVPGFHVHLAVMEEEEVEAEDSSDPVTSMWNCLRRGFPLMTIYNALRPAVPLNVDVSKIGESKIGKAATFKFLQACMAEQKFPPNECFLITDLYGGDTTGFVKVTKVVNRVLDILSRKGLLLHTEPKPAIGAEGIKPQALSFRQNLVQEIVMTERDYVQHLETLQQFKNEVEESGAIAGDAVHDIFLNLNALLDFQRRFLIRIEQQNSLPESQQNWGQLFIHYKESFRVYEPFIANQIRCNNTIMSQWDKLKVAALSPSLNGLLNTQSILSAFLLKPFQRLSKYPMLLNTLREKGGLDEERNADLSEGAAAAEAILHRANDAVAKEQRLEAVAELQSRVEDWKGHKLDHFGELLLYGNFTVLKGEGAKEVEREVRNIFDSQNPKCRAIIRRTCPQVPSLRSFRSSRTGKTKLLAPLINSSTSSFQTKLKGVPEENFRDAYEEPLTPTPIDRSIVIAQADRTSPSIPPEDPLPRSSRKKSPRYKFFPDTSRPSPKIGPPMVGSPKIGSPMIGSPMVGSPMIGSPMVGSPIVGSPMVDSPFMRFPKIGSAKISPRTPSSPYPFFTPEGSSQISLVKPYNSFDDIEGEQPNTPSRVGKVKAPGALSKFGNSYIMKARRKKKLANALSKLTPEQDCDCPFVYFNGLLKPFTDLLFWVPPVPPHVIEEVPEKPKKLLWKKTKVDQTNVDQTNVHKTWPSTLEKDHANELGLDVPVRVQYKIYLFQRILLCCKEINPNKPKNKMLGTSKPLTDKKGKLRLQLKGRIFMQNVTDVVSVQKDKQFYTIQIFWKGDPGVENFVVRFTTEELMIKWRDQVSMQKHELSNFGRSSGQVVTSDNKFTSMEGQPSLENPYLEEDIDEDDSQASTLVGGQENFATSRNASSNSLRSAATLAGATMLPLDRSTNRVPLPRFPHPDINTGLTLHTNIPLAADSPGEFAGNSYFSPTADSPGSTRSSTQAYTYPFTPQALPNNGWRYDDNKHKTAPALARPPSRDGVGANNSFPINSRAMQNSSLAPSQSAQHIAMQSRLRSASTPDIHNPNSAGPRRYPNGQLQPSVDVPPLPTTHIAHMRLPINRSQTNSPTIGSLPVRSATQSPQLQSSRIQRQPPSPYEHDQLRQIRLQQAPVESRSNHQATHLGLHLQVMAPFPAPTQQIELGASEPNAGIKFPTQLKVKTLYDPQPCHVTIVVAIHIKFQSLADRIDSKMTKITSASIASGTARLRYKDDQDFVKIESDEDVRTAIETWGEINEEALKDREHDEHNKRDIPDFELYWHETIPR